MRETKAAKPSLRSELSRNLTQHRLPDITFLLFITAISFFVLRNLSIFYVAIPPLLAFVIIISGRKLDKSNLTSHLYHIFLALTSIVAIWSVIYNPDPKIFGQIPRLFVAPIIPILALRLTQPKDTIQTSIIILITSYIIAVFTYFYQISFGAIEWFNDEAMERGIVFRYATNLGSGNIYGIGLAGAIIFSWFLITKPLYRALTIALLFIGAILSIQKAALINLALAFIVIFLIENRPNRGRLITVFAIVAAGLIFIITAFPYSTLGIYIAEFLNNTFAIDIIGDGSLRRDTVLDGENITDRVAGLHTEEIMSSHSLIVMLLMGIGISGAGGGLGLPEYLQAHSTFWDLFFIGGLPYLTVTICLIIQTQSVLWKKSDKISKIFFWSNVVFIINMTSSSAAIFHPILSLTFWLSIAHCMISRNKRDSLLAPHKK